jgi:hypothetical protein
MQRPVHRDSPRSWGPQSTAIPVGGGLGILAGLGLMFGVAYEVPEVRMWALLAMPASLVISLVYVVVQRASSRPPTTLHLDGPCDAKHVASEPTPPLKGLPNRRWHVHDAGASC